MRSSGHGGFLPTVAAPLRTIMNDLRAIMVKLFVQQGKYDLAYSVIRPIIFKVNDGHT